MPNRMAMLLPLAACLLARADQPLVPLARIVAHEEPAANVPLFGGRILPFRVRPGYMVETPWLGQDDLAPEADPGPDWLTLSVGNDNPYFDFRRRSDPGGVGFTRLSSQVQLLDTSRTSLALCFSAVSPAGLASDGLADNRGATVLMPALSFCHALDEGTAVLLSVGTNLTLLNPSAQPGRHDLQYGLAVYRSLGSDPLDPWWNVYVSVEALGQQLASRDVRGPLTWEVLPGLHWKPATNWTLSGAMAVPMVPRAEQAPQTQTFQIRWMMQF